MIGFFLCIIIRNFMFNNQKFYVNDEKVYVNDQILYVNELDS